jgi:hypothetical protein
MVQNRVREQLDDAKQIPGPVRVSATIRALLANLVNDGIRLEEAKSWIAADLNLSGYRDKKVREPRRRGRRLWLGCRLPVKTRTCLQSTRQERYAAHFLA